MITSNIQSGPRKSSPLSVLHVSLATAFISVYIYIVNRNTNPSAHKHAALYVIRVPYIVASHLKILIPVGTAIINVADVQYARVSTSILTVNMWRAHTTNPSNPIAIMAKIIPRFPNASLFPLLWQMTCGYFFVAHPV